MVDTCLIREPAAGPAPFDPATGQYTPAAGTTIYQGKCRLKAATFRAVTTQAGERAEVITQFVVEVPVDAIGIKPRQVVTIIAAASDPDAVNQQLQVADVPRGSLMSCRRLVCKEFT